MLFAGSFKTRCRQPTRTKDRSHGTELSIPSSTSYSSSSFRSSSSTSSSPWSSSPSTSLARRSLRTTWTRTRSLASTLQSRFWNVKIYLRLMLVLSCSNFDANSISFYDDSILCFITGKAAGIVCSNWDNGNKVRSYIYDHSKHGQICPAQYDVLSCIQ